MEKEFGHKTRLVTREDQHEKIGSDIYHGALLDEVSGGLNPAQYVAGLSYAAEKAGGSLCARAREKRVERGQNCFTVKTERGPLTADSVLVATSGYTGNITRKLQKKIIPIGSFIIATEKLPRELAHELSPKNRMIFDYKHYLNYFRLWDDRMIFGGRAAFFPETANTIKRSAEILQKEMIQVYPQLRGAAPSYAVYAACKAGMNNFTRSMALELAGHGIRVNAIAPDFTLTPGLHGNVGGPVDPASWFQFPSGDPEWAQAPHPSRAPGHRR